MTQQILYFGAVWEAFHTNACKKYTLMSISLQFFVLDSPSVLTEAPVQAGGPAQTGDAVLLSTTES